MPMRRHPGNPLAPVSAARRATGREAPMARADRADIDAIAATWVVREDRGPLPEPERLERDRWLAASPRHYGAYARARAVLAWSGRASGVAAPVRDRKSTRLNSSHGK